MSAQYTKTNQDILNQPKVTAGSLKQKSKKKKTKSLSAKLRMKAKKGGDKWNIYLNSMPFC